MIKGLEAEIPHEAVIGQSVCEERFPMFYSSVEVNIQSPEEQAGSQCFPFLYSPL